MTLAGSLAKPEVTDEPDLYAAYQPVHLPLSLHLVCMLDMS